MKFFLLCVALVIASYHSSRKVTRGHQTKEGVLALVTLEEAQEPCLEPLKMNEIFEDRSCSKICHLLSNKQTYALVSVIN